METRLLVKDQSTGKWHLERWEPASLQEYVGRLWNRREEIADISRMGVLEIRSWLNVLNAEPVKEVAIPVVESTVPNCERCGWAIYDGKNGSAKDKLCHQCYLKLHPQPSPNERFKEAMQCIEYKPYPKF